MPSVIINWETPNVISSVYPNSTYVYDLTANGFTTKHTASGGAGYARIIMFNDSDFVPTGYTLKKVKITATFNGSDNKGGCRIYNPTESIDYDYLKIFDVSTMQRTETYEALADDLIVGDGQHGVGIGYYLNSFSTYYCYFSGVQFELIYEADATKLFSGETPVTSAYLGNTKLTGIYLGDTKLL